VPYQTPPVAGVKSSRHQHGCRKDAKLSSAARPLEEPLTGLEWVLILGLGAIYFALIFTVAVVTFRKGHMAFFIIGIFLPIFWLIGAMLPPKPGSGYQGPI